MENSFYNDFIPVGYDCFSQAISADFGCNDLTYVPLKYIYFEMLYKKESFFNYDESIDVKQILDENNPLIIASSPMNLYRMHMNIYINNLMSEIFKVCKYTSINSSYKNFISNILEISNRYNVIVPVKPYLLGKEYYQLSNRAILNTPIHYINVIDLNIKEDSCTILDKYFKRFGKIKLSNLKKAYIEYSDIIYFMSPDNAAMSYNEKMYMLMNNINHAIEEKYIEIEGHIYYKGKSSLKKYLEDFSEIAEIISKKFGELYVSQFIAYPLYPIYQSRRSMGYLYKQFSQEYNENIKIDELIELFDSTSGLWWTFDALLDKVFLNGEGVLKNINRFKKILKIIIDADSLIYEELEYLLAILRERND